MTRSVFGRLKGFPVDGRLHSLAALALYPAVALLLALVFLTQVTGAPAFVEGWRVAAAVLLVAALAASADYLLADDVAPARTRNFLLFLGATLLLLEVLQQSRSPGVGLGWHRGLELALVFGLLLVVLLAYPDYRTLAPGQWLFVGCVVVLAGLFFVHALAVRPASLASRWPLWAAVVAGVNLLVVPRFVPDRVVLWSLAGLAALASLAGLRVLVAGDYAVLFFEVQTYGTRVVEPIQYELPRLQSVFTNPNTFGLVAYGGMAAATILFHRAARADRWLPALVAAVLLGSNVAGLIASTSRASWFAAAVFLAVYLSYVAGGRELLPAGAFAGGVLAAAAIVAVYEGWLPADPANRFTLWRASVEAFRESPSLFGHGFVSTADFVAPTSTAPSGRPRTTPTSRCSSAPASSGGSPTRSWSSAASSTGRRGTGR